MSEYQEIFDQHKDIPGGIIQAYHAIQDCYGYIPEEAVTAAAKAFKVPKAQAYGVATFYSYFRVGKRGRNVIRICESAPCHIAGADEVIKALEQELGNKIGATTADGRGTLEFAECVGQCQSTPVITVNSKPYANVTADSIAAILAEYK